MRKSLLIQLIMLAAATVAAAAGFVPVRNFPRAAYNGGPQNWVAIQDSAGRILVGNRDGMLLYDGIRWEKHFLSNYTTVRSLRYDDVTGRIYAGGSGEFGFFRPDSLSGRLRYSSLIPLLGRHVPSFSEIWNILDFGSEIWFQGDYLLFRYDGQHISVIPAGGRVSRSAVIGDRFLLGMDDGRILRYDGTKFVPIPEVPDGVGDKIMALLPGRSPGEILIAGSSGQLLSLAGGEVRPVETGINSFLRENRIFSATSRGSDYVFGTVNGGAVAYDFVSGRTRYMNKEGGMQNNTILALSFDRSGNLLLCLDNGFDYAMINSPIRTLIGPSNDIGAGYASLRYGSRFYFGTNQGLYSSDYPFISSPNPLDVRTELQGQVWSVTESGDGIFAATDAGLFHNSGSGFSRIDGLRGAYMARALPSAPDLALVSTYDSFHLIGRRDGRWVDLGPVSGYDDIGGRFSIDNTGSVWLSHFRKGVYRMRLNPADRRFDEVRLFTTADGLNNIHNNSVTIVDGDAVIGSEGNLYAFDPKSDRLSPHPLDSKLSMPAGQQLVPVSGGRLLTIGNGGIRFVDSGTAISVGDMLIPGFESVSSPSSSEIVVSNQEGFWSLDPEMQVRTHRLALPFVSAIVANTDSLVYVASPHASRSAGTALTLTHDLNSLRFDFGYTDFSDPDGIEFSSMLDGYDTDWSPYSAAVSRGYTRLSYGNYTFRLRARNARNGEIAESEMSIRISPPWYHTPLAHIIYILLALAATYALYLLFQHFIRRSQHKVEIRKEKEFEQERIRAEQEALMKDYEIASLKSEQLEKDVRHKSSELSNTTMNLIRKNEILTDIAGRISRIETELAADESAAPLCRRLERIRSSIKENISHDDDWKTFTRNFDIVYADYTRRLTELHPELTAADQRLCCYIRMRLSSKEIAPLVNISYKSVEMARYRLRKKMHLAADVNLTDYLVNL